MNVLQIIPSMDPDSGGTSQGIRNIIPELEQLGVYNEVLCLDDPANNFTGKDPFITTAIGHTKGPWRHSPKLVPWLVDNLGRFDVVIVNALWLYHGYAIRKALQQYKKLGTSAGKELKCPKIFVMPHGMLDPYFQRTPGRRIKALRNRAYWKLIESKLVNNSDGLLFTCEQELLLARETFRPYRPAREINIGYGVIAPPPFETVMKEALLERCPGIKGHPFILFLSRIHEKKGTAHLIKAYLELVITGKEMNGKYPGTAPIPKLIIAGPGLDTPYGKKIQLMVAASPEIKNKVIFPGMLTGNAKWGAFYQCEAFILPSHQENFGIAVVEALACGKPVLISNQVNIWREIVGVGGGLVADDTEKGTLTLLESWQKLSVQQKEIMGANATMAYENHFKIESAAKKLLQALAD
ncbi:MAG: glycosyltransferase [Ferruginibacter sp.]|nr:glycosyltransferase [Ferruginibacter sp.]